MHSSYERKKVRIRHGERREESKGGRGSGFWSGATWENGRLVTI
jgi:hypothetical protein